MEPIFQLKRKGPNNLLDPEHVFRRPKLPKLEGCTTSVAERTRSDEQPDFDSTRSCFMCGKERDKKGKREIIRVSTKERQESIFKQANAVADDNILRKVCGYGSNYVDMVAAGYKYHRSCMRLLFNKQIDVTPDDDNDKENIDPFQLLLDEVTVKLLTDRCVYRVSQLRDRYRVILSDQGIDKSMTFRSDALKRRLTAQFGERIQIFPHGNKSDIVCASSITVAEVVQFIAERKDATETLIMEPRTDNKEKFRPSDDTLKQDIYSVGKHIRNEVKRFRNTENTQKDTLGSVCMSFEYTKEIVPTALFNMIGFIISPSEADQLDEHNRLRLGKAIEEKVISICQDIMHGTSGQQLPKQVGLALHVLKQTRSKEIVTMLHRFGHSISYTEAQRYITTLASKAEDDAEEKGIFIPSNVVSNVFTQYAFDNLDFLCDSKSGHTFHATTHNIYQYPTEKAEVPSAVVINKSKQTSLKPTGAFTTNHSGLTLYDRRQSRSIKTAITSNSTNTEIGNIDILDITAVWMLLRRDRGGNVLNGIHWSGFHENLATKKHFRTTIGYGPMFPQSPTSPDVVMSSIDYCMKVSANLGLESTVVTCDQAIYDIVKGLQVKHPEQYKRLVVRLGGFHIAENFAGAIGKLMRGGGLEEVLIDNNMCGEGTVSKVMNGRDYYKVVRYHTLLCEVFFGLFWASFEQWWYERTEGGELLGSIDDILGQVRLAFEIEDEDTKTIVQDANSTLQQLQEPILEYIDSLGPTGKYWCMYIDMVMILLRYIAAERIGNWDGHLREVKQMLPYLVSAGHSKYTSCIPLYLHDMDQLHICHPEVYSEFQSGKFNVHVSDGTFNGVWTDMAIEQTYNKEGKTMLFKGLAGPDSALTRKKYIFAAPVLTEISESIRKVAQTNSKEHGHHTANIKSTRADRDIVTDVQEAVRDRMVNPFCTRTTDLVNIATGEIAKSTDIVNSKEIGLKAIEEARYSQSDKIILPKPKGFDIAIRKAQKKDTKLSLIYKDETSVTRALCYLKLADEETRNDAFSYEWTEYPTALFEKLHTPNKDNSYIMRKGNKCDYLSPLMECGSLNSTLPQIPTTLTAYVVDMMGFINRAQKHGATKYDDLPKVYIQQILQNIPDGCRSVHIVGDRYDFPVDKSIKVDERSRRYDPATKVFFPSDNVAIPDWKDIMKSSESKQNLLNYLSEKIVSGREELLPTDVTFILGGTFQDAATAVSMTRTTVNTVPDLESTYHEEADTRIMLHLSYCSRNGFERVIINCTDTDIILLCMYYFPRLTMKEIWIHKGSTYIPVHELVRCLSENTKCDIHCLTSTLLACYVLSGCDSCSYMFRRGKKRAARIALTMASSMPALSAFLNEDIGLSDVLFDEARRFIVQLYGHSQFSDLNQLRQHIFATSSGDLRALPPTEDAFHQHVLRCLYQLSVFAQALLKAPELPDVSKYGRKLQDGRLYPIMTTRPSKPPSAKLVKCTCSTSKCLKNCTCAKNGVQCFIGCKCLGKPEGCGRVTHIEESDEDDI